MYKFLLLFLVTCQFNVWGLHCSNYYNLSTSSVFPNNNDVKVIGNDAGTFCIGWFAEIEDNDCLQVSQKLPGVDWSQPEIIAFEDEIRSFCRFDLKLDESNTTYALWEMDRFDEADIFFSKKPFGEPWSNYTHLAKEYYENAFAIGLTKEGHSHIISENDVDAMNHRVEALHFFREGTSRVTPLTSPFKSHFAKNLSIDDYDRITASWVFPVEGGVFLEYTHNLDGIWSQNPGVKKFHVNSNSYTQCLVTGLPGDLGILLLPFEEGMIVASSPHQDSLTNFGQKNDVMKQLSYVVDQKGNIGIAWEISRNGRRGIGISTKLAGKSWSTPFELFPTEGKYKRPKIVEAPEGNFVVAWEKHLDGTSSIVGSTLSIQERELSSIEQLSPLSKGSSKYIGVSLFFSKTGMGYIGWTLDAGYQSTAQVAEIHL